MQPLGAVAHCAHTAVAQLEEVVMLRDVPSLASWANLKVFQSEWMKKLDPHAILL